MKNICISFYNDEAGFIVSAELVLVSTITVLALVVGLSEVAFGINGELEDVGAAFGSLNQSFCVSGFSTQNCGKNNSVSGSCFSDHADLCDGQNDIQATAPMGEQYGGNF
ncbi:MAG TPA: branched-chain amino acid aminotransferase [Planctomycetaceae bacterium]|jgi:hypothetical protein